MVEVRVDLPSRPYSIFIGSGLLSATKNLLPPFLNPTAVAILVHPRLSERYAAPIAAAFDSAGIHSAIIHVPAGERYKNLQTVARIYPQLLKSGIAH